MRELGGLASTWHTGSQLTVPKAWSQIRPALLSLLPLLPACSPRPPCGIPAPVTSFRPPQCSHSVLPAQKKKKNPGLLRNAVCGWEGLLPRWKQGLYLSIFTPKYQPYQLNTSFPERIHFPLINNFKCHCPRYRVVQPQTASASSLTSQAQRCDTQRPREVLSAHLPKSCKHIPNLQAPSTSVGLTLPSMGRDMSVVHRDQNVFTTKVTHALGWTISKF